MFLRLETLQPLHLMGFQVENPVFSMEETSALWRSFRSRMNEIGSGQSVDLYSVQIHDSENTGRISCRWAAAMAGSAVPYGMEELRWEGGLYAVFLYRGGLPGFEAFLRDVFTRKIPELSLLVDDRPHFQLMGKKYNPFSEESEEEVWIPVLQDADQWGTY